MTLPDSIRLYPPVDMLETTVKRLPKSKSIAARALILGALAGSDVEADKLPSCDDIYLLKAALDKAEGAIDLGSSGTAMRFLTAFFAAQEGCEVELYGSERLSHRPLMPLVSALRQLGADIVYLEKEGFLPIKITGKKLTGGEITLDSSASSQFASALAMIAPTLPGGLRINLGGQIPSLPYLKMTLEMLAHRGIEAHIEAYTAIIPPGKIEPCEAECEPDWSAASYWYAIAAASAGWITIPGLAPQSLQGDSVLKELGERFGVITEFTDEGAELSATPDIYSRLDMDMSDWPDLVPMLAVIGAVVGLPYVFQGVGSLRLKESDRLAGLSEGLAQIGVITEAGAESFAWEGERVPVFQLPQINPHGDHRIAMAFAAASFAFPGIVIHSPRVVDKSYPGFFDDLLDAGFIITAIDDPVPDAFLPQEE